MWLAYILLSLAGDGLLGTSENKGLFNRRGKAVRKLVCLQVVSVAVLAVLVCGCMTGGKGPDDRELITNTMNEWKAGLVEKDADKIMSAYSENFQDNEGRGKADMANFIKEVIAQGYLDSTNVDLDSAQITINGEDATVSPISLSSAAGSMVLSVSLKKEDGVWRIVKAGQG